VGKVEGKKVDRSGEGRGRRKVGRGRQEAVGSEKPQKLEFEDRLQNNSGEKFAAGGDAAPCCRCCCFLLLRLRMVKAIRHSGTEMFASTK
jgi:hypothetical protein